MTHVVRSLGIALLMLISSVFVVGVIAQDGDRELQPNGHGIVVDGVTGAPLHALVFIVNPERDMVYTAETGRDGIFKLHLPAGGYVWEAEAEQHHPGRGEFRVSEKGWEIKIVLEPLESVEPEEPEVPEFTVAGMLVHARTNEGVRGYIGFINPDGKALEMETEEDGEFKALLPPGPWMWKAGARGFEVQEGRLLIEREPVRLMIKMVPLTNEEPEKRGAYLFGHVITPEGKPIPGAFIYIHPMMMEEPPVRPGIPEDPPERPMTNDRDPATRASETDKVEGITYRMFLSKLSEKFEEPVIERIFKAADADGDGILNEREMIRVHEMLREMVGDEPPERPPQMPERPDRDVPERERPRTRTDERGMFKVGLPFGEYVIMAEAEGFHPNRMPVRISPRMDKYEIKIVLEPMERPERPEKEHGRTKIVFSMEDPNSDGNPEMVKFAADLNGDGVHEIVYHMIDRNSDGTPDSVEWVLDIPMEMWQKVMGMVMKFIQMYEGHGGMVEWGEWDEMGEEWDGEDGVPFDWDMLREKLAERMEKDPEMVEETDDANINDGNKDSDGIKNGDLDSSGVSSKTGSNDDSPLYEVLAAIGVLALILAILLGVGIYIRKKSE